MSDPENPFPLAPKPFPRERLLLFILAAVQFTHILDYMIMMPLADNLMDSFKISPAAYTWLVAIYSISAAVVGFGAGFVMDRLPRRGTLLWLYSGFAVSTICCALAPNFELLLCARTVAGACGGVASSVVGAMIADVVPPGRRGRASAVVGAAFPLAMVAGLPAGLFFVEHYTWHTAFFALGGASLTVLAIAAFALPPVPSERAAVSPAKQMKLILTHPIHIRAFLFSGLLITAGAVAIPFMVPSMKMNVGLSMSEIEWMYVCGGIVTFATTNLFGRLSDRFDKLRVLAGVSLAAIVTVLIITQLNSPTPLVLVFTLTSLFFVTMSGRFSPAMAMVINAVEARYRGGFMSINSSVQQTFGGIANIVAGLFVMRDDISGKLTGFPAVGVLSALLFVATVLAGAWVRKAAPHAAKTPASDSGEHGM